MNQKRLKANRTQSLAMILTEASTAIKAHWIYDAVQLLNSSAIALQRIEQLLAKLKKKPKWRDGREAKIKKELSELMSYIKEWNTEARERLSDSLILPDGVESRLRSLLGSTNVPIRLRRKMRRRWTMEKNLGLLEPPILDIARQHGSF